jgi:hypothetical protein
MKCCNKPEHNIQLPPIGPPGEPFDWVPILIAIILIFAGYIIYFGGN